MLTQLMRCFRRIYKFHAVVGCALVVRAYYYRSDRFADWQLGDIMWRTMCTAVAFDFIQAILMLMGGTLQICQLSAWLYMPRIVLCVLISAAAARLSFRYAEPAEEARQNALPAYDTLLFASVLTFEYVQFIWEALEIVHPSLMKKIRVSLNSNEEKAKICAVLLPHTGLSFLGNQALQDNFLRSMRNLAFWAIIFTCKSLFVYSFLFLEVMDATVELLDAPTFPLVKAYPTEFGDGGEYATIVRHIQAGADCDCQAVAWTPLALMWFLDTQIWYLQRQLVSLVGRRFQIRSFNHMARIFHTLPKYFDHAFGVGAAVEGDALYRSASSQLGFDQELEANQNDESGNLVPRGTNEENPWAILAPIWNMACQGIRSHDLISNRELDFLLFRPRPEPSPIPGLPLFLLGGEITRALDYALGIHAVSASKLGTDETTQDSADKWKKFADQWQYMLYAIQEAADLAFSLTRSILGERHFDKLQDMQEWVNAFEIDKLSELDVDQLRPLMEALLRLSDTALHCVENVRKLPQRELDPSVMGTRQKEIEREMEALATGTQREFKAQSETSLGELRLMMGAVMRVLLLRCKAVVTDTSIHQQIHEILFAKDGWFWDVEYCQRQVSSAFADPAFGLFAKSLGLLLRTAKLDTVPENEVARDQLTFFANSLLMNIPKPSPVGSMRSWSVLTPYYSEDVTQMFYLQMLLPDEWNNCLERLGAKNEEQLKSADPMARRLWASYRGQTLSRTIRGMMSGEAAVAALAQFCDGVSESEAAQIAQLKIYGQMAKSQDPKCAQINLMMKKYRNLRVSFIDEKKIGGRRPTTEYYSVLVKAKMGPDGVDRIVEVYRVKLPGLPIVGEGKPENQNHALIFTRGEYVQTIDMNQDWNFHECLKVRNLLQEFAPVEEWQHPPVIAGFRENIFSLGLSSIGTFMALQDTSFVTINQRMLYSLDVRMHYGHPDIFDKMFVMSSGGVSKASKFVNLSEDIFAG